MQQAWILVHVSLDKIDVVFKKVVWECRQELLRRQSQKKAGLTKGLGIHSLRHTFATHALYQGMDLYTLKRFLGHPSLKSTIIYLHLIPERLQQCKSPLYTLYEDEE